MEGKKKQKCFRFSFYFVIKLQNNGLIRNRNMNEGPFLSSLPLFSSFFVHFCALFHLLFIFQDKSRIIFTISVPQLLFNSPKFHVCLPFSHYLWLFQCFIFVLELFYFSFPSFHYLLSFSYVFIKAFCLFPVLLFYYLKCTLTTYTLLCLKCMSYMYLE